MNLFDALNTMGAWAEAHPADLARMAREGKAMMPDYRRKMTTYLKRDPVLRAYLAARESGVHRNTTGWHAYGEWLMTILMLAGRDQIPDWKFEPPEAVGWTIGNREVPGPTSDEWADEVMGALMLARPYLWRESVLAVIRAAPEHPPCEITSQLLPHPIMFWSYETAMDMVEGTTMRVIGSSDWMMLAHTPRGARVFLHLADPTFPFRVHAGAFMYGTKFPDDYADAVPRKAVNRVLSMLAFLNSPYVEATDEQLPRHFRRQERHEYDRTSPAAVSRITVVSLRRAAEKAVRDYEATPREWRHRWWVSGHFRQQPWGTGRQQVRTVWIAPYLKGPVDKPMLEKVYDVKR